MRLRATVTVPPLTDVDLLRRVVPHLLAAARAVPVVDGIPVDARGRPCPGITVSGVHPRPGAIYRFVLPPAPTQAEVTAAEIPVEAEAELVALRRRGDHDAVDDWYRRWVRPRSLTGGREVSVELVRDTAAELTVLVRIGPTVVEVDLVRPSYAEAVRARVSGEVATGTRFFDGVVSGDGEVALDRLPPNRDRRPQLVAGATHRRGSGSVELLINQDGEQWKVRARIQMRGRGVLRPVVFLAGIFGRRRIERLLADDLGATPPGVGADELRTVFGREPDPAEMAAVALERVLVVARPDR